MNIEILNQTAPCLISNDQHWEQVNLALGPGNALKLKGPVGREECKIANEVIINLLVRQASLDAALKVAYTRRDELRARLIANGRLFINTLQFYEETLGANRKLPKKPYASMKQLTLLQVLNLIAVIWEAVELNPPPALQTTLVFLGYKRTDFVADLAALTAAYSTIIAKLREARTVRNQRRTKLKAELPRLREYAVRIEGLFAPEHPLRQTVPVIFARKGVRPVPVQLRGSWDAGQEQASLSWTPNTQEQLKHYEIRACDGSTYRAEHEYRVATVETDATTIQIQDGLVAEGSTVSFRVYVITESGRERGSNTIIITRAALVYK